jgi:hypothetical protein
MLSGLDHKSDWPSIILPYLSGLDHKSDWPSIILPYLSGPDHKSDWPSNIQSNLSIVVTWGSLTKWPLWGEGCWSYPDNEHSLKKTWDSIDNFENNVSSSTSCYWKLYFCLLNNKEFFKLFNSIFKKIVNIIITMMRNF